MMIHPKLRNTYQEYYNLQPNGNYSWPELRKLELSLFGSLSISDLVLAAECEAARSERMQGMRLFKWCLQTLHVVISVK